MQTAHPDRPRRRQPPPSNGGASSGGYIGVILVLFFAGVGAIASIALVGAYTSLASDLPPTSELTKFVLSEESIIYDRTGETELARFGDAKREVVTFEEIPPIILDATTAIEDKTFWENAGFDPVAIVAAALDSLRGNSRGASTITQQLVRARLLDPELVQDPSRTAERKLKEIIQSIRVTQAYPGDPGKREIITAYLNQNYYGNQSYGVKSAYEGYFGKPFLAENITPAEAAIIAGLPKSPSNYDLVRNAIEECDVVLDEGQVCPNPVLVVPEDTTVVQRRNDILDLMAEGGRTPISEDLYSPSDFEAAKLDEVLLAGQTATRWLAPHFVWAVRDELTEKLCGPDAESCDALERGGLRITTTVDLRLQAIAERWVEAAAIVPHRKNPVAAARALGFEEYPAWLANLENKNLRNGALVALDYQTGELVAYVGSAKYYATNSSKRFQPQYDVVGQGFRQPGSAFKPFNYAIGIEDQKLTAGTMLMDAATDFSGYTPNNADNLERGPVRVRSALQFSLNIPSVKAAAINGVDHIFDRAKDFGMTFQSERSDAGLALALGVQEDATRGPRHGLWDPGQRRAAGRPHDDPHRAGPERQRCRAAAQGGPGAGGQPADGVHRHGHPGGQHELATSTRSGAGSPSRAPTAAGRPRSRPGPTTTRRTSTPTGISPHRPRTAGPTGRMRWRWAFGTATATTARSPPPRDRSSRSTSPPTCGRGSSRRRARTGR